MKVRSTLVIACLAVALVMTFGIATSSQAECCFGDAIAAPFYAAAVVVGGAASLVVEAVSYPFTACGCKISFFDLRPVVVPRGLLSRLQGRLRLILHLKELRRHVDL